MFGVPSIEQPTEVASAQGKSGSEVPNADGLADCSQAVRDASKPRTLFPRASHQSPPAICPPEGNRSERLVTALEAIAEQIQRVADHLIPPATSIVGSKYVAGRLGCTTTWVGRMASNGMIPRKCVVPGTGEGRLWKFYRQQVDEWLTTRAPNGSN